MKPLTILWPLIPVLALTACSASTGSGDPGALRLPPLSPALVQPCDGPGVIPLRLDQRTQEAAWRRDRINLAQCRDNHALLIIWAMGVTQEFNQTPKGN